MDKEDELPSLPLAIPSLVGYAGFGYAVVCACWQCVK
jgi:hypothetical protein